MSTTRSTGLLLAIAASLLAGGCTSSAGPAKPQTQAVTYRLPSFTPQSETKPSQTKGDIEISISPESYTAARSEKFIYTPTDPSGMAFVMGPTDTTTPQVFVTWTKGTAVSVKPDRVRFMVKLNNQLSRVFHGAGMVVQFNVGGQLLAVQQDGYAPLTCAIVPPRTEQEVEIVGPTLESLKGNKGILGVFLYDVVTNQDAAGNVTEKQNFEWYFDYTIDEKTEELPFESGNGYMPVATYQRWRAANALRP